MIDRIEEYRRDWISGPAPRKVKPSRPAPRPWRSGGLILVVLALTMFWGHRHVLEWKRRAVRALENEWKRTETRLEVSAYTRELRRYRIANGALPPLPLEYLKTALQRNKPHPPGCDFWGTPYRVESDWQGFRVRSAGPNGRFGDADDLSESVLYKDLG